eukprot:1508199-Alexandrium_andersonii.AAC.1
MEVSGDSGRLTATARAFGLRAAEAVGPGEYFYGCEWKPGDAMTEALAWLVCRGLRPKVVHCGSLHCGRKDPPKKMELLAAERAREVELIALLVEDQAQVGACVSMADTRAVVPGG